MHCHACVLYIAVLSCLILLSSEARKNKKLSAPVWKSNSMPNKEIKYKSEDEYKDVKLDCKTHGHPKPSIKWLKNGVVIRKNRDPNIKLKKYGLTLMNVTTSMSGNYSCLVENKVGSLEWTFLLSVRAKIYPLKIQFEGPNNITRTAGETAMFKCRILNDPKGSIAWERVRTDQGDTKEILKVGPDPGVLTIENVQKEDEGEYRCIVANVFGFNEIPAYLTVNEPPVTIPTERPQTRDDTDLDEEMSMGGDFNVFHGFDPQRPKKFDVEQNPYSPTTKKPRKNKKNKGRKNGKRKNKKNKSNKFKTSRPQYTTTSPTPIPTEPTTLPAEYYEPSRTTVDYFSIGRSTLKNEIWTYKHNNNPNNGFPDNRSTPKKENTVGSGTKGRAKGKDKGEISAWKIYTIVGVVGGVVLLIGLIAITITLCCPKQEAAVYKATPV